MINLSLPTQIVELKDKESDTIKSTIMSQNRNPNNNNRNWQLAYLTSIKLKHGKIYILHKNKTFETVVSKSFSKLYNFIKAQDIAKFIFIKYSIVNNKISIHSDFKTLLSNCASKVADEGEWTYFLKSINKDSSITKEKKASRSSKKEKSEIGNKKSEKGNGKTQSINKVTNSTEKKYLSFRIGPMVFQDGMIKVTNNIILYDDRIKKSFQNHKPFLIKSFGPKITFEVTNEKLTSPFETKRFVSNILSLLGDSGNDSIDNNADIAIKPTWKKSYEWDKIDFRKHFITYTDNETVVKIKEENSRVFYNKLKPLFELRNFPYEIRITSKNKIEFKIDDRIFEIVSIAHSSPLFNEIFKNEELPIFNFPHNPSWPPGLTKFYYYLKGFKRPIYLNKIFIIADPIQSIYFVNEPYLRDGLLTKNIESFLFVKKIRSGFQVIWESIDDSMATYIFQLKSGEHYIEELVAFLMSNVELKRSVIRAYPKSFVSGLLSTKWFNHNYSDYSDINWEFELKSGLNEKIEY